MRNRKPKPPKKQIPQLENTIQPSVKKSRGFHLEFLNAAQRSIWSDLEKNDIIFLLGSAGTGKTFIATAYSIYSFLRKETSKIMITRPIVEAGASMGYLPGSADEKLHPYMLPIYDTLDELVGKEGPQRMALNRSLEVAPLAYLRGRTFKHSVCLLDEAQNCTYTQIKLFLTRIGEGSKLIITGDPFQSDLGGKVALMEIVEKLSDVKNIAVIKIGDESIVRHPIIGDITSRI
jgi:phosphate starvation-inducible PhoH-like protein